MNEHVQTTLQEVLANWTDPDETAFLLGQVLGIFPPEGNLHEGFKWIFWTDNPLGNAIYEFAHNLVRVGALDRNEDEQFRWNTRWDPTRYENRYEQGPPGHP